jgi:hypothetical protein
MWSSISRCSCSVIIAHKCSRQAFQRQTRESDGAPPGLVACVLVCLRKGICRQAVDSLRASSDSCLCCPGALEVEFSQQQQGTFRIPAAELPCVNDLQRRLVLRMPVRRP